MKQLNLSLLLLSFLMAAGSHVASAVGTPAGTVIQTRSKVVFSTASGAVSDTVYSNYVSFTVAQVAAVNMTPASNAQTTARDSIMAEYALTLTNSGNGADQFSFSLSSSRGWSSAVYTDANGDGILQSGEISAGAITQSPSVEADGTFKFIVRIFVPKDPSLNGVTDTTTVTAASMFDASKTNTAQMRTTVQTVNFPSIATGLTVSPTNPSPGDQVIYSITFTNSGSVAATDVSLSDLVDNGQFSFVSASGSQGTVNTTANPVLWNIGTIVPGGSVTVSITLQVNSGLPNGTVLNNTLAISYSVGGTTFTVTTNNPSAAIGVIRSVSIGPLSSAKNAEPEDTLTYPLTVKNLGNAKDVLELEYNSTKSYSWSFYKDSNGNGVLDAGEPVLTNTNGTGGTDADSVNAYDSIAVIARMIVPMVEADQTQDITTVTVRSAADQTKFQSANVTSTINIPDVTVTRAVSPEGNQQPGTEMTFTVVVHNSGNGKAYNVALTEIEPDHMTYVENSVTISGSSTTDAADEDGVTVTTVEGKKVIALSVGTLNGNSPAVTITYKATID